MATECALPPVTLHVHLPEARASRWIAQNRLGRRNVSNEKDDLHEHA
jgi:hypothetical protein